MTPVAWMLGIGLGGWLAVTLVAGERVNPEVFAGMIGPLVTAVATWVWVARVHAVTPERLTAVMVAGFGAKMVFFGAYVVVALRGFGLRPDPVRREFRGVLHHPARDRGAVPQAPVRGRAAQRAGRAALVNVRHRSVLQIV